MASLIGVTDESVERVVFFGDFLTAGTPPTQSHQFYRSKLATELAGAFGLAAISPVEPGEPLQRRELSSRQWGRLKLCQVGQANRAPHARSASKARERQRLISKYIQRYTLKNDTIGFFG